MPWSETSSTYNETSARRHKCTSPRYCVTHDLGDIISTHRRLLAVLVTQSAQVGGEVGIEGAHRSEGRLVPFQVYAPREARLAAVASEELQLIIHQGSMRGAAAEASAHRAEIPVDGGGVLAVVSQTSPRDDVDRDLGDLNLGVQLIHIVVRVAPRLHEMVIGRRVQGVEPIDLLHRPPITHIGAKVPAILLGWWLHGGHALW